MITIKDVAKEAKVVIGTVSNDGKKELC